ncbi:MAG TPA: PEGA domain-containing protein [Myxococcaceae bacterium]|nr:PEGA domain-containing protein [Myxococcaceae bacterium]
MKGMLCALLVAPAALAAPRTAVLAMGNCSDADLLRDARLVRDLVEARLGAQVLTLDEFRRLVGEPPTGSLEEVRRTLARAEALFYADRPQEALVLLDGADAGLARLPPGTERWNAHAAALLLRAMTLSALRRREASDDAFRQILRLEPTHRMSASSYSPALRARFERLRQEQARSATVRLAVTSSPPGSTVYLDGLALGQTPFARDLTPGVYQLVLAGGGGWSFPRTVALRDDLAVHVDVAFERSVPATRELCLETSPDSSGVLPLGHPLRLGLLLELEQLVLVHLDRDGAGPLSLTATVVDVPTAQRTREGWLRVSRPGSIPDGVAELATFAVTGVASDRVAVQAPPSPPPPPPAPAAAVTVHADTARSWKTPTGIGLTAAGAVCVSLGVLFLVQGNDAAAQFNAAWAPGGGAPRPAQATELQALADEATSKQTLGLTLLGVGAAAAAAGVGLWVTDAPGKPGTSGALIVTPASLAIAGHLP